MTVDEKFKNKYRVKSARLECRDYSRNGVYFITICTAGRDHLFGKIIRVDMMLSEMGNIVLQEWKKSFEMRSELFCDAFVIMPNHIHAIVRIEKPENTHDDDRINAQHCRDARCRDARCRDARCRDARCRDARCRDARCRDARPCVSTENQPTSDNYGVAWRPPKSVSSFVAGFKSAATKRINALRNTPGLPVWQSRFHDHIIRDEKSYDRIKEYILNNPMRWQDDVYNE